MKTVVLCPPDYFGIEYEINPWMHLGTQVDKEELKSSYQKLKLTYESLGCTVWEISPIESLPDMVYSANFGFPIGKSFILSNFKFPQRKKEAYYAEQLFLQKGYEIKKLPEEISYEGQGDLLTVGGKYFFGWGKRSDKAAKAYLEKYLNAAVNDFELVNPYYYHLDTCFAPITEDIVAINPLSFTSDGLEKLKSLFSHIITVDEGDNALLACNLVVIEKTIVIAKGISEKLKGTFANYGFKTIEIPMDEYRKGGGSIKCLTLENY